MPRRKKVEDQPVEKILELLDAQVQARGDAVLAADDATAEIARLTTEARRKGVSMNDLTQHVKRMDKRTRKLVPMTRQAIDSIVATAEQRREPRTTRASRRRRDTEPVAGGGLNVEAFQ